MDSSTSLGIGLGFGWGWVGWARVGLGLTLFPLVQVGFHQLGARDILILWVGVVHLLLWVGVVLLLLGVDHLLLGHVLLLLLGVLLHLIVGLHHLGEVLVLSSLTCLMMIVLSSSRRYHSAMVSPSAAP